MAAGALFYWRRGLRARSLEPEAFLFDIRLVPCLPQLQPIERILHQ
jgi:hypothetical protein